MTPEQIVRDTICEWLSYRRAICSFWIHYNGGIFNPKTRTFRRQSGRWYKAGVADINGSWYGRTLVIETKAPGSSTDPERLAEQIAFLEEQARLGGIGILAFSLEDVLTVLGDGKEKAGVCFIGQSKGRGQYRMPRSLLGDSQTSPIG